MEANVPTQKTLLTKQHEAMLLSRRQEREMETQRLNKLKAGLQEKLQAKGIKVEEFQAA
jgi:hypothetical protein